MNTHPEQWAANAAAPGEQLGVRCLAQGFHLSRGIEGGESAGYSLPPPTFPAGPETRTRDLTSPTLYPLGHDCQYNSRFIEDGGRRRKDASERGSILVADRVWWLSLVDSCVLLFF